MSFTEAITTLSREDRFRATVAAMNTLLIQKGIYTTEEFEGLFVQWASRPSPATGPANEAELTKVDPLYAVQRASVSSS